MTVATEVYSPPARVSAGTTPASVRQAALAALTLCTLLIHGYHPFAEDGGLYVAGVQSSLDPSLFPYDLAFVTATQHYSLFTPCMALIVRSLHVPLPWLLLIVNLTGTWLILYASWRIAALCVASERARLFAAALVAAWFTLPIAGTSLLLMDPYVTARTLATPLSLLAASFAASFEWSSSRIPLLRSALFLFAAAAFHPLMAAYAAGLILTLLVAKLPSPRARIFGWTILAAAAILTATAIQATSPPESPATVAAAFSRYYWFLSQWQWFELLGITGPLVVLALLLRFARPHLGESGTALCRASIAIGLNATLVSLFFAHERYSTHLVARLQPLRTFLLIYAVMIVLLGATLANACLNSRSRLSRTIPPLFLAAMACTMLFVQRQTFPNSQHLELPWRVPTNTWSQAFAWARQNTSPDALFAIDDNYITTDGEDGQTFRATAQRSVLPDFSKDGGEAAIRPSLSATWFAGRTVQSNLSQLTDLQRSDTLRPLGVTWVVLHAGARTSIACPYENAVVKVCPLP